MITKNVLLGNEGIRELKEYFRSLESGFKSITEESEKRIAQYGEQQLQSVAPMRSVDGNMPGSVYIQNGEDMTRVVYAGQDVAYIEFGTGYRGQNNPYPDEITLNNANWVYDSNEHGYGGWVYKRKDGGGYRHSRGMIPEAPVLKAFKKTQEAVPQIIREVMDEKFTG